MGGQDIRSRDKFTPWNVCALLVMVTLFSATCRGQGDNTDSGNTQAVVPCQPGWFGANCTGECHCLNGPSVCDAEVGTCSDYQCDRGWTDPAWCQTECPEGSFGVNCQMECHCTLGDSCNKVNGLCSSFQCHPDWTGAGCQIRLPKLTSPPSVQNVSCDDFYLWWRAWANDLDIGDPPVATYTIQQNLNSTGWQDFLEVRIEDGVEAGTVHFEDVNPYTFFEFRIRVNREEFGKQVPGLPGPSSSPPLRLLEKCTVLTTAPTPTTTTPSPTTTTATVTTVPATTTAPPRPTTHNPTTTEPVTTQKVVTSPEPTTESMTTTVPDTTTTPLPNPPDVVGTINIAMDQAGDVTVTWTAPVGPAVPILGYNFTYQLVSIGNCNQTHSEPIMRLEIDPSETSFTLEGLSPWSQYHVTVAARNIGGVGEIEEKMFYSQQTVPTGAVENISHEDLASTSVTFTWDDVPCAQRGGFLLFYDVILRENLTGVVVQTMKLATRRQRFDNLVPYTQYSVDMAYKNQKGTGPISDDYVITTLQDVPPAPRNVQGYNATDTTLYITWSPPVPPHGVLLEYRVIYWVTDEENAVEHVVSQGARWPTDRYITALKPYTTYSVQVQARTEASNNFGWGPRSVVISDVITSDGDPSFPRELTRTERNQTCLTISWNSPEFLNGIITKYKITYRVVAIQSISDVVPSDVVAEVGGSTMLYMACSLIHAAQYRFSVQASTRKAYGPAAIFDAWTEVGVPDIPPRPEVKAITMTTVTITIQPVVLRGGPVSGYFIVVSDISLEDRKRKKRALPDPIATIPLPGYTAAFLERDALRKAKEFIVGDGATYGTYENHPLTNKTTYNIFFVVASSLDEVTKMSFAQIPSPVTTGDGSTPPAATAPTPTVTTPTPAPTPVPSFPQETTRAPESTLTPAGSTTEDYRLLSIILPVVIGVVVIVVIVVVVFCCCRKKKKLPKEDFKNTTWLKYYNNHFFGTLPKDSKGKWNDIYEMEEPRYVTVNDKKPYNPEDLKVSDIHHSQPKISFEDEYKRLPQGKKYTTQVAERPENAERNRFHHLLAYDHSRVVLRRPQLSDYINANYVHGYGSKRNAYIAAQSPFDETTIGDFWYMIYQENATQIVFLANLEEDGIVKSEQYWPDEGTQQFGLVLVRYVRTDYYAHFVIRQFDLQYVGSKGARRVSQFHFTSWPEHGVPDDPIPFLDFRLKVKRGLHDGSAPMVVHCGTGVSRAAVFIATDSLLEQAMVENCVNVYKFCHQMRKARTMMVRTLKQYVFLYDALFEALLTNHAMIGEDMKITYRILSQTNPVTSKSYFREQFEVLEKFVPPMDPAKFTAGLKEENIKKNRFSSIIPPDDYRVTLHTPGGLGRTDFINALHVDSYLSQSAFIVTQTPMRETVIDFWKLVYDYDICCIVMLNGSDYKEETCVQYWPDHLGMEKMDPFFVRLEQVQETDHVTIRTFKLSSAQKPSAQAREVRQFQLKSWHMYEKLPWSRDAFVNLIEMTDDWLDECEAQDTPVLVHCADGASQSGLYCASHVICEKLNVDGEVDIFHTVKHMKTRRPHFINSLEQYKFCFKILWDYYNTRMDRRSVRHSNGSTEFNSDSENLV